MKTNIINKLHLIRKILSLTQLFLCIVVFAFGLIVLIIGCVALATANRDMNSFFTTNDFVSGANLLITAGLFSFIIAAIGLVGSVPGLFDRQDNWNLWIALIADCIYLVILLLVIIFQIAAGGWAYTKWDYVSSVLTDELIEEISGRYDKTGSELFTEQIDNFQLENKCCGISNHENWRSSDWRSINNRSQNYEVPLSCCGILRMVATTAAVTTTIVPITTNASNATTATATATATTTLPACSMQCTISAFCSPSTTPMPSTETTSTPVTTNTALVNDTTSSTTSTPNNTTDNTTTTSTETTTTISTTVAPTSSGTATISSTTAATISSGTATISSTAAATISSTTATTTSSGTATSTCPVPPYCTCTECIAYTESCDSAIVREIRSYTEGIAGVGIAFGILELIIMLVPICLIFVICIELRRSQTMKVQ